MAELAELLRDLHAESADADRLVAGLATDRLDGAQALAGPPGAGRQPGQFAVAPGGAPA